jgi:hypothetical protein
VPAENRVELAKDLLTTAAAALTACSDAGLKLKVRHGVISCSEGFILPLDDGSFAARTRIFTEFSRNDDDED